MNTTQRPETPVNQFFNLNLSSLRKGANQGFMHVKPMIRLLAHGCANPERTKGINKPLSKFIIQKEMYSSYHENSNLNVLIFKEIKRFAIVR